MTFNFSPKIKSAATLLMWLVLIGYAWYIRESFAPLAEIPSASLVGLCLLIAIQLALQIIQLPLLLSALGSQLKWHFWLPLGIISSTLNMLLPAQGGTALRTLYLKSQHNVPYSDSIALSTFQVLIRTLCVGVIALVTLSLYLYNHQPHLLSYLLYGLGAAAFFLIMSVILFKKLKGKIAHPWLFALNNALRLLSSNYRLLYITISLNLLIFCCNAALFALLLGLFGMPVSIELILLYTSIKFLVLIFNLLPGNMGISEILTGFFTQLIQGDFEIGVAVAICARTLTLAVALSASGICLYFSKKDSQPNVQNK